MEISKKIDEIPKAQWQSAWVNAQSTAFNKTQAAFESKINAVKKRTALGAGAGAGIMVAGIVLTATSQTALGLSEQPAVNHQASALKRVDRIYGEMLGSLAKRADAQTEVFKILTGRSAIGAWYFENDAASSPQGLVTKTR